MALYKCCIIIIIISHKRLQTRVIVTIEGEQETAPKLSNGYSFNDLE